MWVIDRDRFRRLRERLRLLYGDRDLPLGERQMDLAAQCIHSCLDPFQWSTTNLWYELNRQ